MKTFALAAFLALAPAQDITSDTAPKWVDFTLDIEGIDATLHIAGDLAVVTWAGRVIGPLPWADLPGVPGQAEAKVGTTLCVTIPNPTGPGFLTYPAYFGGEQPTIGAAVAQFKASVGDVVSQGGVVTPCVTP